MYLHGGPKEKRHMVKFYSFSVNWGMIDIVDSLLNKIPNFIDCLELCFQVSAEGGKSGPAPSSAPSSSNGPAGGKDVTKV